MEPAETSRPADALRPVFARHETFAPRYGWLKKAYDAALVRPDIFLEPDAPVELGVGKNMVRAMRYWAEAFKVLDRTANAERPRLDDATPTPFGDLLLAEDGWDPYLESRASLWLLHWKLLEPPCIAPSWFFVLGAPEPVPPSAEAILARIQEGCAEHPDWGQLAENSLRKDLRCLLRMYASVTSGRDLAEDTIDSPFAELGLLRPVPGANSLAFVEGPKPGLADAIVVYASLRYGTRQREALIPLSRLASDPGSPGVVFKLSERELCAAIERAAEVCDGLALTTSAASPVLVSSGQLADRPEALLDRFYARAGARAVAA